MHVDLPLSPLKGTLRVWLFKNVENVPQLRDSIVADATNSNDDGKTNKGSTTAPSTPPPLLSFPDASFLNAALVPDLWTLRLAAYAAEASARRGRARARSRHTELVVALSGGKNISWALSTFGLSGDAKHLVVARFVDGGGDDDVDVVDVVDDKDASSSSPSFSSGAGRAFAAALRGEAVLADDIERELASLADGEAQARAYKITTTSTEVSTATTKEKAASSAPSSPTFAVEVGPLADAVACRIAVRDC